MSNSGYTMSSWIAHSLLYALLLESILKYNTIKNKEICFWASRYDCFKDGVEFEYLNNYYPKEWRIRMELPGEKI